MVGARFINTALPRLFGAPVCLYVRPWILLYGIVMDKHMPLFCRTFSLITVSVLMLQANGFHHSALKIRSFKMGYDIAV